MLWCMVTIRAFQRSRYIPHHRCTQKISHKVVSGASRTVFNFLLRAINSCILFVTETQCFCPSPSAPELLKSVGMLWWLVTTIHVTVTVETAQHSIVLSPSPVFFKVLMKIIVCSYHKYKVAFVYILWFSVVFCPL
jgi:hypothetical protein